MPRLVALRLSSLAIGLIAVAIFAGCAREPYPIRSPMERFQEGCRVTPDHHEDWHINPQMTQLLTASGYCHYQIPEYHDEQQLSDGDDGLGPVVKVFASPNTEGFRDHTPFDRQWVNVAILLRDPGSVPQTYVELGLQPEATCMYLRHVHNGGAPVWEAMVVQVPASGVCEPAASSLSGAVLAVVEEKPFRNASEYPAVGRFVEVDVGSARSHTMIGVRCGDAWCNAGPANARIPRPAHDGHPSAGASSRWRVKGWFDDQTLSAPHGGSAPGLRRELRASIVPVDNLGQFTVDSFRIRRHVATVVIPPGVNVPEKYANPDTGYGFVVGVNQIELIWTGTEWQAYIVNSGHPSGLVKPVHRTGHEEFNIPVPATARWRWSPNDEQIWVRCDVGCCRIIENES